MTSSHPIDVEPLLADQLVSVSPDLLRGLLTFIAALIIAEADGTVRRGLRRTQGGADQMPQRHCGDTHVVSRIVLADWLLTRRRRAEGALTSALATCYLMGMSTRRTEQLVESR
jgi:putative transposase